MTTSDALGNVKFPRVAKSCSLLYLRSVPVNRFHCLNSIQYDIFRVVEATVESIHVGTVTSARGFYAGATYAGIKKESEGVLDLGILRSEVPCVAAAMFTTNRVRGAPVVLSQERIASGRATAVVVNSGCANASTGEPGLNDAAEMANLTAEVTGIPAEDILVASTGVIGQRLPMKLIRDGIKRITLSADGGHQLAKAIMTTDTVPKEIALAVTGHKHRYVIGGVVKGVGMVHPNLATMLCFLATDAAVDADFLKSALKKAVDTSFNMVSIDGDTSPNDTVLIMANGMAGNDPISAADRQAEIFQQALNQVCIYLAKSIARDGEGATKLIEVTVGGALNTADARIAARTIVSSPLVKAALYGNDPNWGRVLSAAGRSGAEVVESKVDLYIGNFCLVKAGSPLPFDRAEVAKLLDRPEVLINLQLNLGTATATAWGCDLTEEYVTINSKYTT